MEQNEFDKIAEDTKILSDVGSTVTQEGWTSYMAVRIGNQNRYVTVSENDKPQAYMKGVISIRNLDFDVISTKHIFFDHPYMKLYEILKTELEKSIEERVPQLPNAVSETTLADLLQTDKTKKSLKRTKFDLYKIKGMEHTGR